MCFSLYTERLKLKITYLFIINLVITNKPGKKTKIRLITKIFFSKRQKGKTKKGIFKFQSTNQYHTHKHTSINKILFDFFFFLQFLG
jgi:hypothetical protein